MVEYKRGGKSYCRCRSGLGTTCNISSFYAIGAGRRQTEESKPILTIEKKCLPSLIFNLNPRKEESPRPVENVILFLPRDSMSLNFV
jgi:hypothetical protein